MNRYVVIITFPQAPSAQAQMEFREDASSVAVAIKHAMDKAVWRLHREVKHRSLDTFGRVTWQCVGKADKLDKAAEQSAATVSDGGDHGIDPQAA